MGLKLGVEGLGLWFDFRDLGLGFEGLRFGVKGFGGLGVGFEVRGSRFGVWGLRFGLYA